MENEKLLELAKLLNGVTLMLRTVDGIHEVSALMHDRDEAERLLDLLEMIAALRAQARKDTTAP